jgi:hypothetical protein
MDAQEENATTAQRSNRTRKEATMNNLSEAQAVRLARRIDNDQRGVGRYDAHGLNEDRDGWCVCVSDTLATRTDPCGRQLEIRRWAEWEQEVA